MNNQLQIIKNFIVVAFFISVASIATVNAATYTVNSTADTAGTCAVTPAACTFRQAVESAGANDTILFDTTVFNTANCPPATPCQINTGNTTLFGRQFTIEGPGARILTVNSGTTYLFEIRNDAGQTVSSTITIRGLSFTGDTDYIIRVLPFGNNVLNLENVRAFGNNNGSFVFSLGATQSVNVRSSLFHNNGSNSAPSSVFVNYGNLQISNSTFTANNYVNGSAINNQSSGSVLLNNVTIAGNGGLAVQAGGGIYSAAPAANFRLRNSIIASNIAASPASGSDLSGNFTSLGNNIIGTIDGATGFTNGVNGDQVGTAGSFAPLNPLLSALENQGGQTNVLRLLTGSPAINAGNNCVKTLSCPTNNPQFAITTDQRGTLRDANTDIGAFELSAPTAASVTIGGRVLNQNGRGIPRAVVSLTDDSGNLRYVRTNTFGYYRFNEVSAGQTIIIAVHHKSYEFQTQVLFVAEDLQEFNIIAL